MRSRWKGTDDDVDSDFSPPSPASLRYPSTTTWHLSLLLQIQRAGGSFKAWRKREEEGGGIAQVGFVHRVTLRRPGAARKGGGGRFFLPFPASKLNGEGGRQAAGVVGVNVDRPTFSLTVWLLRFAIWCARW